MSNVFSKKVFYYCRRISCGVLAGIFLFAFSSKKTQAYTKEIASQQRIEELKSEDIEVVALTFDDGPSKEYTEDILDILKEEGATATFFVLGNRIKGNEDILIRMIEEGHEIGIHGYSHKYFTEIGKEKTKRSIERTSDIIEEVTGICPVFVRPPYGKSNKTIRKYVAYPFIKWQKDSNDWKERLSDEQVIYNATYDLEDGDIILFHDIHARTLKILEEVIEEIKKQGFIIVSVDELFQIKDIEPQDGIIYKRLRK
jgi:peptidoglycan/xylan/chitin deacetylase (PgdA/CDA1 family)